MNLMVLVVLLLQYGLGMSVNLFVGITRHHPGADPKEYFSGVVASVTWALAHGPVLLTLHTALGLILVVLAMALGVRSWLTGSSRSRWLASAGVVFILGAGFNGGSYLNYSEGVSSFIMAILFALAVVCYVSLLYAMGGAQAPSGEHPKPQSPAWKSR